MKLISNSNKEANYIENFKLWGCVFSFSQHPQLQGLFTIGTSPVKLSKFF